MEKAAPWEWSTRKKRQSRAKSNAHNLGKRGWKWRISKLTPREVWLIRSARYYSNAELSFKYGVTKEAIIHIRQKRIWKNPKQWHVRQKEMAKPKPVKIKTERKKKLREKKLSKFKRPIKAEDIVKAYKAGASAADCFGWIWTWKDYKPEDFKDLKPFKKRLPQYDNEAIRRWRDQNGQYETGI